MQNLLFIPLLLVMGGLSFTLTAQELYVVDDNGLRTTEGENVLLLNAKNGSVYIANDDEELATTNATDLDISNGFYLMITGADSDNNLIEVALKSGSDYIHLDGNNAEVNLSYGMDGDAKYYAQNASPSGEVGHYRLYNHSSGLYLYESSGGVIGATHRAEDALVVAFAAAKRDEQVYDCMYRMDSDERIVFLETVEQYKVARKVSTPRCPSGSFFDIINGGTCWSCPSGYKRTVFAVNSGRACERAAYSDFRKADSKGKGTGLFGTDCPRGAFLDPNGYCYSCPSGYKRTVYAVTSNNACEKVFAAATSSATQEGSCNCPGGSFFDLVDGGTCWTCPDGYRRTVFSVNGSQACELK